MACAKLYPYYGGKARMTKELKALIPKCRIYIEPFFGSGAVFLALDKEQYEHAIVNDMEEGIIQFIRLLSSDMGEELIERLSLLEPDEYEFKTAKRMELAGYTGCSEMQKAIYFYRLVTQSYNCLRKNYRRGMDTIRYQRHIFGELTEARKKLLGTEIRQGDAYDVIEQYKNDDTAVMFIDSPYVHRTRKAVKSYYFEMSDADHVRMLLSVRDAKAKCILCGYQEEYNGLYDRYLLSHPNWNAQILKEVTKPCANRRGSKGEMAQEWIWKNF